MTYRECVRFDLIFAWNDLRSLQTCPRNVKEPATALGEASIGPADKGAKKEYSEEHNTGIYRMRNTGIYRPSPVNARLRRPSWALIELDLMPSSDRPESRFNEPACQSKP